MTQMGDLLSGEIGDGEYIGRTTSSTHFKRMTNTNTTAHTMNTGVIQAAFFDANVVAPLAIVMGV